MSSHVLPRGPSLSGRVATVLVAVSAIVVCVLMAHWQWDRAHRTAVDAVPTGEVVALSDLDPTSAFSGMRVRLTGRYDQDHTFLVGPRRSAGVDGAWVLTALTPDDGPAVAVVRGWIPAGATPAPAPTGTVHVLTVLVADEERSLPGAAPAPGALLPAVDTGALASGAGFPVRSGWFAVIAETGTGRTTEPGVAGSEPTAPSPLQVADLPGADLGMNWRNAAYALQWLVFAGFVVLYARGLTRSQPRTEQQTQEST